MQLISNPCHVQVNIIYEPIIKYFKYIDIF